ncbi:histidinol-phosphatase HisJ [Helicobacter sp. 11S03491-1]|uniref:histidinol-phosphatase HisJ n=1 Tax=Helicobacter sp. 11S03491-1 TaxID=1476196 RepID=UPI000BA7DB41|nr:histidinol-phosphatase HisJ [Helicobacter sp. 11S03491-1]PAF42204.1 histidinol phosphate phosphatase [Helicobacter sp. 11S03491-1]
MRIDLHNHTTLCNHASGSVDEYILKAIDLGIDIYGFSCHAPMKFDTQYRMKLETLNQYCQTIQKVKQKYQDKIEILLGLEVDFISGRENLIEKSVLESKTDYLIGSVHFLDQWGFDNPEFMGEYAKRDMQECWKLYLDAITKMAQSKLFQIVGHFDLLKIFGNHPQPSVFPYIQKALEAIRDNQMALEINGAGLAKPVKEQYPSDQIISLAKNLEIPITFGSDAHSVEQVGFGYQQCVSIAKKSGYKNAVFFRNKIPHFTAL